MKSIREIMGYLEKETHIEMMHAFDNGLPHYVEYAKGCFIGVNITPSLYPKLNIQQERGAWCAGEISQN